MRRSIYTTSIAQRSTREQLEALTNRVLSFPAGKIIFDAPVSVMKDAGIELFSCYGAWADKQNGLWLMDGYGEWHQLCHDQLNAACVITSLNQQLKILSHERSKVLPEC
jgi:hypothetical protein